MPSSREQSVSRVLAGVRRSLEESVTDGALLARFVEERDPKAFEDLVRRHGPMVLGVCLRILRHQQDAEDAFQATFLVLATKAAAVSPRELVGNWLHGVAVRTAIRARAIIMKRKTRERDDAVVQAAEAPEVRWDDVAEVLDEELGRLPAHYRAVVLLCDLEGRSRREAATHLGCPEGSIASRLSRARAMLARRLTRRGVALPATMLAVYLSRNTLAATVSSPLLQQTVATAVAIASGAALAATASPAASTLARGVLLSMLVTKLKVVAVVGTLVLAVGAVGLAAWGTGQVSGAGSNPLLARNDNASSVSGGFPDLKSRTSSARVLDGDWEILLPAGYRYKVRLEALGDHRYRLASYTVFGGTYRHEGENLRLETPAKGQDPKFRLRLDGALTAVLVDETLVFGQKYVGTRWQRIPASGTAKPRDSIDLGTHLVVTSSTDVTRSLPSGLYVVADTKRLSDAELYEGARSGSIPRGSVELIAHLPSFHSKGEKVEIVSFEERDRKITVLVRRYRTPEREVTRQSCYLRAWLPGLPPGEYAVTIRMEDRVRRGKDDVPLTSKDEPTPVPLTCAFEIPNEKPTSK